MKGGVGKTTLTFNLALYLAEKKAQRVLVIDLDPQANATIVSIDPENYKKHRETKKTVADIFIHTYKTYGPVRTPQLIPLQISDFTHEVYSSKITAGRFDIIPSELMLSSVLKGMTLGPYDLDKLLTPQVQNQYDYILVDCAPTNSALTTIALNTTKAVLIPMISDSFGVHGTDLMNQVLKEHKDDYGLEVKVIGVVFTMWEQQINPTIQSSKIIKGWPPNTIFNTKISKNNWYMVANGKRKAIWNTPASAIFQKEFDAFVTDFIKRA